MEKKYALGIYEKALPRTMDFREKLRRAKKRGYDFLEISIDETEEKLKRLEMSPSERAGLLNILKEEEMPLGSMCLSGHRRFPLGSTDPAIRKKGMEIAEKALGFAEDLGIRVIQLAGYDVYYEEGTEETEKYFRENLFKFVEKAAKHGILLGFETMETAFMDTVEKALSYVESADSPYLGIYPDLGNLTNAAVTYGSDAERDLMKGKGHLLAVHIKETLPGSYREIPFGSGHVFFDRMIEISWKAGVRRFVTEFWDDGKHNWERETEYIFKFIVPILDRLSERKEAV